MQVSAILRHARISPQKCRLVADLVRQGQRARYLPGVEAIVDAVASGAREGDLVIVMSNGGFDGIHDKLLARLSGPEPHADERRAG